MKTLMLVAAGLLVACERDLPTTGPAPETTTTRRISPEQAEQAQLAIDDALVRVIPELSVAAEAGPLASRLAALQGTLKEGPVDEDALARAMAAVAKYGQVTGADSEELDVIRLALEVVRN